MKAIIIMGSTSDEPTKKITNGLDKYGISWEQHAASAHKEPTKVLEILDANKNEREMYTLPLQKVNALSGFVAANSEFPTLGCPFLIKQTCCKHTFYASMPSNTPVLTVIDRQLRTSSKANLGV